MSVSKEGTWDCFRIEGMRTFLSSQPVLCHASRRHRRGFVARTPHPSHRLQQIRGGGWGEIREAARMETRGHSRQRTFGLSHRFLGGSLPHVACSLVQARPCEPSGMPAPPFLLVPLLLGCSPTGLRSGPFSQVAGGLTSLNLILETAGRESEQSKRYLPF